ncbi:hypothetical protein MNBD_ALPHA11-466 [hydrothermal vent metagenome]|uniref:Uncharacterized protein n=1 Tax=hydrothermal vent metagenome TaxID=652676 RepID=A0A3B0TWL2_9ZZZZ
MMETNHRLIAEADDFLNMMRCAYHEAWRRRFSDDPEISATAVIVIYEDCQYYRNELARIVCGEFDKGRIPPERLMKVNLELDATWRSLYWAVVVRKKPHFVPKKV